MYKKIIITTLTAMLLITNIAYGFTIQNEDINAEAAILMDGKTGQVLYEKNIHEVYYPASITKIMTTLLGIENSSPIDIATMSRESVFSIPYGAAHIALDTDEEISMEDLLYAAMLQSANEACNGIAEQISGSITNFSDLMNKRALEAGALSTNFVNTNGLHNDNHYTTAYDMAMITRAAIQNPMFREIIQTKKHEISPTNKQRETRYLWNTHKMLKDSEYAYDGILGGKTGYTSEALNTLVTVANKDGRELIVVLLKSNSGKANYLDTTKLLNYGFNEFKNFNLNLSNIIGIENFSDEIQEQITNTTYLIHNSIGSDQINGSLGAFDEDAGVQEIIVELDSSNEFMPQRLGKMYIQMPIKTNLEISVTSIPWFVKAVLYLVAILLIVVTIIYFFINRNYYKKKLRKTLRNIDKKRNPKKYNIGTKKRRIG